MCMYEGSNIPKPRASKKRGWFFIILPCLPFPAICCAPPFRLPPSRFALCALSLPFAVQAHPRLLAVLCYAHEGGSLQVRLVDSYLPQSVRALPTLWEISCTLQLQS